MPHLGQHSKRPEKSFFTISMAVLLLAVAGTEVAKAKGKPVLRLMTYNIRYANPGDGDDAWPARRQSVVDTIRAADVVGLQEVVVGQLRDLKAALPEFTWVGVARGDGKEAGEFSPIGVRTSRVQIIRSGTRWLSETPDQVGSRGWDAALPRIATWALVKDQETGAALTVINTHFDHIGVQARLESGRLLRQMVLDPDYAAADVPVVVMGDLNALPGSPPLQALTADGPRRLSDSRSISQTPPAGPSGTWNGFREIVEGRQIDHILVTTDVQVHSHQVLDPRTPAGRFASDHLPVLVTLQIAPSSSN